MTSGHDSAKRKADCLLIDTNIWRSNLLLKNPVGVALAYALGRQGGFIALPEVVEEELAEQIIALGLEEAVKLVDSYQKIKILTDAIWDLPVMTRAELGKKLQERLAELNPILVRVPFTVEHAKAALKMVMLKLPPNGEKNQQFKDSAIWQAVLALSQNYSAHLISADKGFFLDREPSKGLALNLLEDCQKRECIHA